MDPRGAEDLFFPFVAENISQGAAGWKLHNYFHAIYNDTVIRVKIAVNIALKKIYMLSSSHNITISKINVTYH